MPAGQPTKLNDKVKEQVKSLALLGLSDKQIADGIGVTEQTINNWKIQDPEFFESLKDWKVQADQDVEKSLYQRARGYTCKETKTTFVDGEWKQLDIEKHYAPDPTSMIFWLKNRKPKEYRDKQEVGLDVSEPLADLILNSRKRSGIK